MLALACLSGCERRAGAEPPTPTTGTSDATTGDGSTGASTGDDPTGPWLEPTTGYEPVPLRERVTAATR